MITLTILAILIAVVALLLIILIATIYYVKIDILKKLNSVMASNDVIERQALFRSTKNIMEKNEEIITLNNKILNTCYKDIIFIKENMTRRKNPIKY